MTPLSHFTFLKAEWPELHAIATKVEGLAYPDAWACFYTLHALDALFVSLQHRAFQGSYASLFVA